MSKLCHISAEIEALKMLGDTEYALTGHIKLTAPMMLGQFILPGTLARFKRANPAVDVSVTVVERMVDVVEEGFDLAIRAGRLPDSSQIARKAGQVRMSAVASPAYLAAHGHPQVPKICLPITA